MNKSDIFWQTYLNLEKEAIEVSKFIFITDEVIKNVNGAVVTENCYTQLDTYSPHIADLLVRTCVQIEAISKELYFDNNGDKPRGDNGILFDEDCLKLVDKLWATHNKSVMVVAPFFNLTMDEHRILKPLKEAHRRHEYWEKAYQAVKHDRYSCLYRGNVRAFIQALAALYLLNVYYRNEKWAVRYDEIAKRDYSMGSSLFAVNPPVSDGLWEGNNEKLSDSPFVVRYQDQHNSHLNPEEINESNIQSVINNVGIRWGMDMMKRYQRLEWLPIAMNSGMCDIYIPKKILSKENL